MLKNITTINKILSILAVVLLIILGALALIYWQKTSSKDSYWAVYLNTGDLYFGKLERFPTLALTDVWFLQRNSSDSQTPLGLSRFREAFWGPEDKVYLNSENIIWKTKLDKDSRILDSIKSAQ